MADRFPFKCVHPGCNAAYTTKQTLTRHAKVHGTERLVCAHCSAQFVRGDLLTKHLSGRCKVLKAKEENVAARAAINAAVGVERGSVQGDLEARSNVAGPSGVASVVSGVARLRIPFSSPEASASDVGGIPGSPPTPSTSLVPVPALNSPSDEVPGLFPESLMVHIPFSGGNVVRRPVVGRGGSSGARATSTVTSGMVANTSSSSSSTDIDHLVSLSMARENVSAEEVDRAIIERDRTVFRSLTDGVFPRRSVVNLWPSETVRRAILITDPVIDDGRFVVPDDILEQVPGFRIDTMTTFNPANLGAVSNGSYMCYNCRQVFSQYEAFARHFLTDHNMSRIAEELLQRKRN